MRFRYLFFILFITILLTSCFDNQSKGPDSIGPGSEIIVVCSETKWNGEIGDSIRSALMRNMEGLEEAEPEFTLINISENDFGKIQQTHRNILIIDSKPENKKSKVETLQNVWSHPQRVIKIKAIADTAFINIFSKHKDAIRELYNQSERARFSALNALNQNLVIEKLLSDEFGINMTISKSFYQDEKSTDYLSLKADNPTNCLGLMIYIYPYKDTAQLSYNAVLTERNRYMKLRKPAFLNGLSSSENATYTPVSRKILFKEMFALETRGVCKYNGDSVSSLFVNYSIVDAPRQRIIVFDGVVYGSGKPKRDYIRQLESIIWGAEFNEPGKANQN